jgi:hypothetical protein
MIGYHSNLQTAWHVIKTSRSSFFLVTAKFTPQHFVGILCESGTGKSAPDNFSLNI